MGEDWHAAKIARSLRWSATCATGKSILMNCWDKEEILADEEGADVRIIQCACEKDQT